MNEAADCGLSAARGWRSNGVEAEDGAKMDALVMDWLDTGRMPEGDGAAQRARDVIEAGVLPPGERIISFKASGFPARMQARKEYGPGDVRIIAFAPLDDTYGVTGEPEMVALTEEPNTLEIPDLKDGQIRDKWRLFKQFATYSWLAFNAWPRTAKIVCPPIFSRFLETPLKSFIFLASEREQLREFLIEQCKLTHQALLEAKAKRSDFCHNCAGKNECHVYQLDVTTTPRPIVAVTMPEKLAAIDELKKIGKSVTKLVEELEKECDALVATAPHRFAGKEYGYEEKPGDKEYDPELAARILAQRGASNEIIGKCFKVNVGGLKAHYKPIDPEGFRLIEAGRVRGEPKRVWYEREIPNIIEVTGVPPVPRSAISPRDLSNGDRVFPSVPAEGSQPATTKPPASEVSEKPVGFDSGAGGPTPSPAPSAASQETRTEPDGTGVATRQATTPNWCFDCKTYKPCDCPAKPPTPAWFEPMPDTYRLVPEPELAHEEAATLPLDAPRGTRVKVASDDVHEDDAGKLGTFLEDAVESGDFVVVQIDGRKEPDIARRDLLTLAPTGVAAKIAARLYAEASNPVMQAINTPESFGPCGLDLAPTPPDVGTPSEGMGVDGPQNGMEQVFDAYSEAVTEGLEKAEPISLAPLIKVVAVDDIGRETLACGHTGNVHAVNSVTALRAGIANAERLNTHLIRRRCKICPPVSKEPAAPAKPKRHRKSCRVRTCECSRPHTHAAEMFMPPDYEPKGPMGSAGPWRKKAGEGSEVEK